MIDFRIIAVYRKTHQRQLTIEEMNLAKAVALTCGEDSQIVDNDGEMVPVHKKVITARFSHQAIGYYTTDHRGAEVLFCDAIFPADNPYGEKAL